MKNLKVFPFQNKVKANSKNEAPVYIRIIVGTTRKEFSTGFKVNVDRWNDTDGLSKSKIRYADNEIKIRTEINDKIAKFTKYAELKEMEGEGYTAEMVYNHSDNPNPHKNKTLLQAIELHKVDYYNYILRGEKVEKSYEFYASMKNYLVAYLKQSNQNDILLSLVNDNFQKLFHNYLFTKVCANSANKMIVYLRCIISFAKLNGYCKHELTKYELTFQKVKKIALNRSELQKVVDYEAPTPTLQVTKDMFLFNVVTGYSFIDFIQLTYDNIVEHEDGYYIETDRQKTGEEEYVPLTDEAIELINKYRSHPECMASGKIFPFRSDTVYFLNLQKIKKDIGLEKPLSSKIARNTFVTLGMNMRMNIKVLSVTTGHSNIKQTEEYGSTYLSSQFEEMKKMDGVLNLKKESNLKVA
jgi:integrase